MHRIRPEPRLGWRSRSRLTPPNRTWLGLRPVFGYQPLSSTPRSPAELTQPKLLRHRRSETSEVSIAWSRSVRDTNSELNRVIESLTFVDVGSATQSIAFWRMLLLPMMASDANETLRPPLAGVVAITAE